MLSLRLGKKSSGSWDDVEKDMLGRLGLEGGAETQEAVADAVPPAVWQVALVAMMLPGSQGARPPPCARC